jgi:hypothetical protein
MSFRPYSEEQASRFLELAELMGACRQAFRDTASDTQWRPVLGSAGEADVRAIVAHDPPYPNGVHARLSFLLYFYLSAASEHLGGLAVLYATKEVLFPPGPLIRAVLEHCARLFWFLQQGDSPVEEKLARLYLEELLSAEQAKRTAGRLEGKGSEQYRARAAAFKALRDEAEEAFGGPILDEHERTTIRGQQLIGLEDCVGWMYEFLSHPLPDRQGHGVYEYASNISHPTLYTHFDMWARGEVDGQSTLVSQISLQDHGRRVGMAVVPFYEALGYLSSYYGWPGQPMETLTAEVERLLPEILGGDKPSGAV